MNIRKLISQRFLAIMAEAGLPADWQPHVTPATRVGFGHYQVNGAMAAARHLKKNPRDLAQNLVNLVKLDDLASKVDIAGPGFINIHLDTQWLSAQASTTLQDDRLGIEKAQPQTIVIDYSAPNLAKEMHVGHLRSTIIGDAQARLLTFLGHQVIRQNHVGDWGTQFGMLLAELEEHLASGEEANLALNDLEGFYKQAKQHFDKSAEFADKARNYVVKLQSGDLGILQLWEAFRAISLEHCESIYTQLNVSLTRADVQGESAYNDDLPVLTKDLEDRGLAVEDQGALVAFLDELADKEGNPSPVIIRKQGGGYLYATTDLAAIRYRVDQLKADRIMVFSDARQSLHMQQVYTLSKKAGYAGDQVSLEHHSFGTMMGPDGKPFKTRSGGTIKLADLLQEAVDRAAALITEKNPSLPQDIRQEVAKKVGIGAVKYADLSKTRTNNYIFDWEAMLNFEGNTAPYLQYAYARIQSIFRKSENLSINPDAAIQLTEELEISLCIKLFQFAEVIDQVAKEAYPHLLCSYLYDLASQYMSFYEGCPILKEGVEDSTRDSRLQLCKRVAETLKTGLGLLGIEVMEQM